jgi:hypothetical protein
MKEANDVKTWHQEKADGETINHPQYKIIIKKNNNKNNLKVKIITTK